MQIHDHCTSLAAPMSPSALQTAERLSLRTPMPTQHGRRCPDDRPPGGPQTRYPLQGFVCREAVQTVSPGKLLLLLR